MTEKTNLLPDFDFIDDTPEAIFAPEKVEEPQPEVEDVVAPDDKQDEPKKAIELPKDADPGISAAYELYIDRGIIDPVDDFSGEPEDLQEILVNTIDKRTESALESIIDPLPDFGKAVLAIAIQKGPSLTVGDLEKIFNEARPNEFTEQDIQDPKNAATFMMASFKKQGYSDEDARDMVELLKDKGRLQSKAAEDFRRDQASRAAIANNVVESSKGQRQQAKLDEQTFQKEFSTAIKDTGWRPDKVDKIAELFFEGHFRDRMNHAIHNNPKGLVQLIDFMSYYDPEKGTFDMESYKKEALSPSVKKVAEKIKTNYWSGMASSKKVATTGSDDQYEFID